MKDDNVTEVFIRFVLWADTHLASLLIATIVKKRIFQL